jgi:sugar fermentation stimulation protein A
MKLPIPLSAGRLIRRYQRFLADVELSDGTRVTVHCPNSGSMRGCGAPGSEVLLSSSANPARKYPFTWELVYCDGHWVGINTNRPNRLVQEGIEQGIIRELQGYSAIQPEVRYGANSRIDLLLSRAEERCYVEVKSVTLVKSGLALFPDSVTGRGQKHLRELITMAAQGHRAVNLFVVQRGDGERFAPADAIDPNYGRLLRLAAAAGVEILAYQAVATPMEIKLSRRLPICL